MTTQDDMILVAGGGGFIGGHLVARLLTLGHRNIRVVDIKPIGEWYQVFPQADNRLLDLKSLANCRTAVAGVARVYNLAADMGGMGFIETHKAECMLSVLISTHLLIAAAKPAVERFFYASSACVYNADKQTDADVTALKEEDAYPAMPEDGYGWEKLFSASACAATTARTTASPRASRATTMSTARTAPDGRAREGAGRDVPQGDRGQALGQARDRDLGRRRADPQLHVYRRLPDRHDGDHRGKRHRRALEHRLVELVSINRLVDMVEKIAGIKLKRSYKLDAPKGVRGRNSDNTLIREKLHVGAVDPSRDGMEKTYRWIWEQMTAQPAALRQAS
jgi:GDP-D-mannose 3',5'-epimerase